MTAEGATGVESTETTDSEPCDQLLERVEALLYSSDPRPDIADYEVTLASVF